MNTLVLGSGGREHALAWKLAQSPSCKKVYLHPGNAGTHRAGFETLPGVEGTDAKDIAAKAKELEIGLVVIGPEVLLAKGLADELRAEGFLVAGPNRAGAQLEISKIFAKEFMVRANIPTASYFIAEDDRELLGMMQIRQTWPVVVKLDGLAAGKGVVVAESMADVEAFADRIWQQKEFGPAPHRILVEEFITGTEVSYIGLCDGETFIPLSSATDYKRIGRGNTGPNTGGMGSISPSALLTPKLAERLEVEVLNPLLAQLKADNLEYRGALYIGLMIDEDGKPFVLEFNARFGDPETQALMLRLDGDFAELLKNTATATLKTATRPSWKSEASLYVVSAAEGYPVNPKLGDVISGMEALDNQVNLFYSGVGEDKGNLVTAGGRVLGLGTLAPTLEVARERLYRNLQRINWRGIYYRDDIGL